LNLAVPEEVEIIGRNRRNILLKPKEVKETYWIVKVAPNLQKQFTYTFPTLMYSEQNRSVKSSFEVEKNAEVYSQKDIERIAIQDEDKSYSRKILFDCTFPEEIYKGIEEKVSCKASNIGDTSIVQASFCLNDICDIVDIPSGKDVETTIKVTGEKIGFNKVVVRLENKDVEKKEVISYRVLDKPEITMKLQAPEKVIYHQPIHMQVQLTKESFQTPKDIILHVSASGFTQEWNLVTLDETHTINIELEEYPISKSNEFTFSVSWKDSNGKEFTSNQIIKIEGVSNSFIESVKMFFNSFVDLFS